MSATPPRFEWAVDIIDAAPSDKVLEIGCGSGIAATLLAEGLTTGSVYAIDRSAASVARARRHPRVTYEVIPASAVKKRGFDKAFAFNVTLSADDLATVLGALAPNGALFLFHQPPTPERVRPVVEAARRALESAGLEVARTHQKDMKPAPCVALVVARR